MYNIGMLTAWLLLFGTYAHAEMKCAPGKCGGSMSSSEKIASKTVYKGNKNFTPVDIKSKEFTCIHCNMSIKKLEYATQAVKSNGDTYFFDDIGCMVKWLEKNSDNIEKLYVKTVDTNKWIEVGKAYYSRIAPSPMGYGFAALEAKKDGLISYEKVMFYISNNETLRNPSVKKELLGE